MEKEGLFDFVAVGDTATDAFIRLKDAKVNCSIDNKNCQICMAFGDKIPFEFDEVVYGVGNAANAAVAVARLGVTSALVSNLGDDDVGHKARESLRKNHVETGFVALHHNIPSNYHYVLWYEDERTILVKHQKFPYHFPHDLPAPRYLYLSSLGENAADYHTEIEDYLKKNKDTKLVFQPGTFQMKMGLSKLKGIYKRSHLFFCNVDEAQRILGEPKRDVGILARKLREEGPEIVIITDGPKGAYAYDGKDFWFAPPFPDKKPPYERTGAGDAFASTVTAALILGKSLPEALQWGPINSMSVVQAVGAQKGLLSKKELLHNLDEASASYRPRKIA